METGHKLGPYEILEQIGKGGMGEVYLAQDTRLGRTVAIKVLPAEFAGDSERLARFEQEARAAAALNHPHIAAVYDVGHEDGIHFMVQEHLEGRTLRAAIAEGRLPLKKGLKLALEIVEGLGAAHAEGIVHRDLKPENIFVSPDGHAKILDFGLAKLTELTVPGGGASASMSPTVLGTVAGQMMGTAGYMAPEQVEGIDIDHRADIFAFGCVLYELGAGQQAFRGKNLVDTLHRVSNTEPDGLVTIDGSLPEQLQRILDKSLDKDPAARYQTAGDLAVDLRALIVSVESGDAVPVALAGAGSGGGFSMAILAGSAAASLLLGALGVWLLAPAEADLPAAVTHFEFDLVDDGRFMGAGRRPLTIAPDGRTVAFTDEGSIYLRTLADPELVAVRGTEDARTPMFSPDGEWIAFCSRDQLLKVPLAGGAPLLLASLPTCPIGGSWGSDGSLLLGMDDGPPLRVPEDGGEPEVLFELGVGVRVQGPTLLPGGEWVLFSESGATAPWSDALVKARSLITGDERLLVSGGVEPRYLASGHLTFVRDGVLLGMPFDVDNLETTGGAVTLMEDLRMARSGGAFYDVSASGDLLYFNGGGVADGQFQLAWYDLDGSLEVLPFDPADLMEAVIAPDGARIAVRASGEGGDPEIWMYEIDRLTRQRLTPDGLAARSPVWSPDGDWVYFLDHSRGSVSRIRSDFTGTIETISDDTTTLSSLADVSPDGLTLLGQVQGNGADIVMMDVATGQLEDLANTPASEVAPKFSPDGRLVAYMSNESGEFQIYVRDLETGRRHVASPGAGFMPFWSPNGMTLYYDEGARMLVAVDASYEPGLVLGAQRRIFDMPAKAGFPRNEVGISPDGERFLILTGITDAASAEEETAPRRMQVVLNWGQILRDRVTSR